MIVAGWTIATGFSMSSALYRVRNGALDFAPEVQPTQHGGVYAPVTKPLLPIRASPKSRKEIIYSVQPASALVNHAYMIRQVYEMDQNGPEGHLVA
jgi:hypothetical protein